MLRTVAFATMLVLAVKMSENSPGKPEDRGRTRPSSYVTQADAGKALGINRKSVGVAAWLLLYLSSAAVLVRGQGPLTKAEGGSEYLRCTYFTGVGVVTTEYWYAPNGLFGRAACPRLIEL